MDWKSLMADLRAAGFTQPQLAARFGCGQATIADLARGKTKDPGYTLGAALLKLHAEKCPKAAVKPKATRKPRPTAATL